jgi:hypothetical protein
MIQCLVFGADKQSYFPIRSYLMQKKATWQNGEPRRGSLKFMLRGAEEAISIIHSKAKEYPGYATNG